MNKSDTIEIFYIQISLDFLNLIVTQQNRSTTFFSSLLTNQKNPGHSHPFL